MLPSDGRMPIAALTVIAIADQNNRNTCTIFSLLIMIMLIKKAKDVCSQLLSILDPLSLQHVFHPPATYKFISTPDHTSPDQRQHGEPSSPPCFHEPRRRLAQLQQPPPELQLVRGNESWEHVQPPALPPVRPSDERTRTRVSHPFLAS
jgi:hypothetical protein